MPSPGGQAEESRHLPHLLLLRLHRSELLPQEQNHGFTQPAVSASISTRISPQTPEVRLDQIPATGDTCSQPWRYDWHVVLLWKSVPPNF